MSRLELRIPPPVVLALAALGMWASARALPALAVALPGGALLAALFAAAGLAFDVLGLLAFRAGRTTINPLDPGRAATLVRSGIYRHSRNPMYAGQAMILLAWATWLSHPLPVLWLPGFVAYLTRFQIIPEERILAEKFGEAYADYARTVRRWL